MAWLSKLFARRKAMSQMLRLVREAVEAGHSLWEFRQALARTAQSGDLDALYAAYVTPTQADARRYIETGRK